MPYGGFRVDVGTFRAGQQVISLSDQAFVFALNLPAAVCGVAAAWVVFALSGVALLGVASPLLPAVRSGPCGARGCVGRSWPAR